MLSSHSRPRGLRRLAAGLVLVLTGATLAVVPSATKNEQQDEPRITEAAATGTALAAARRQHEPVLVTSLGTPTRTVSAQPDGTLKAELYTQPKQVRRGEKWLPINAALTTRPDRTVAPEAVLTDLVLSGGGADAPLLRYGTAGRSVALTWPSPLPVPRLDGANATYAEVFPGVDLVLKAEADGVVQHLVVKNAEAARNPALARVRFGLVADGLAVRTAGNAVQAVGADGKVVFATPPASMWDAAGDREAGVGVEVTADSLTLVPDQALLADPAAKFPLTIDPDWYANDRSDWTKVFKGKPDSKHWYGANDVDTWAKVGRCQSWPGCNGIDVARSYFQFDTSFLEGKDVLEAELDATIVYGPKCDTSNHELWMADDTFGENTTWNNAPGGWFVDRNLAESVYTGCAGNKSIGWNLGMQEKLAINQSGWSAYFIRATFEDNQDAWRKYDAAQTKIVVKYNTRPEEPSDLTTDPPLAACKWCGGTPYVGDDFIRLQGQLTDAENDQLTANWDIRGGNAAVHHEGPTLGSGEIFSTDVDLRQENGHHLNWTLFGSDEATGGPWKSGGEFIVDRNAPDKAPGVTSVLYQDDNRWHGGVGVPGTFTFDAAGVSDVDHFLYGWNDLPSTPVDADALGGKASVSILPPGDGPRDLSVQSVDRAGHRSPVKKLHLYVRAGNGPLAQWSFEGNAQDTAFLGDRHGTLSGSATYTGGAVGSAIDLNGSAAYVSAPNTVRTDASLSVSTWVRVDNGTGSRAIISQDGDRFAGLNLWYRPDNGGRWVFGMINPATSDKWADMAWSSSPAQLGAWTQLTAVYDAAKKQLRLYVNGELSTTRTLSAPPVNSTGLLRIGRTIYDGNPAIDYLDGAVDEVKIYDRILTDTEVRAAVSRDNVQVGYWKFDDESGTTAANTVAGGNAGVLQGNAKFTTSGAVNGALQLDDPADFVSTGAPAVRTDQSFSVSAWVRQDQALAPGLPDAAVTQEGAVISGFYLGYRQNADSGGKWEFYLPSADAVDRPADEGVWSSAPAQLGTWTHLTGVYDAPAKQIRLYVNGVLAGSGPRTKGFNATGPLLMGRGKWNNNVGHQWRGGIDEVRAFSRVVSEEEVRGIVGRDAVSVGNWKLDGNTQDSSPRGLHGTPVATPGYIAGQSAMPDPADLAVRLDGSTNAVSAPHVVDTDRSFSVAAWARLDASGGSPAVVSQDGSKTSGFKLRARPDGKWGFVMYNADTATDTTSRDEVSGGTVQIGQWTHLAGVYDAGAKQILLYINGVLAGSVAHTQSWNAAGGLQIGRAKQTGYTEYFKGAIDDVSAYSRTLFAGEVQAMAGRDLSLVHSYRFDESSGRNAADSVGARAATLNGATFTPGRVGNAVTFDGVDDSATTTGVDLRTDQAFTVSSWVKLQRKDCDLTANPAGCRVDAVTADGQATSKFRLGHIVDRDNNLFGAWTFEMPESDDVNAPITKAAVSTLSSELDKWTFLVGVYDPATKKMWLYVDGTRVGDGTLNNAWPAASGLSMGRGKAGEFWPGSVDDVRLYNGQLDKDRISALYRGYPAEGGAATLPVADAGSFKLDQNGTDSTGHAQALTFKGGTSWPGGRNGPAAGFDGTSGYAETPSAFDTGKSFSVAAWAFLTDAGTANRTVLGQDGSRLSAFSLLYNGTTKKWAVQVPSADKDDAAVSVLNSTEPAAAGEWTHLALSYDANLHQVRLYVNGMLSVAQTGITVLPSSGPLSIGRAKWNGANAAFFQGSVDEVRLYTKAISDGEARRVHDDVPDADFGYYRFDDGTAKDSSWRRTEGVLSGGTSFVPGVSGQALRLDGVNGALSTPAGLSMRDSFTVSGWAKLDRDDRVATIASQDGDRTSGWALQYRPDVKRWIFGAAASDSDNAGLVYAASLVPPKVNEWTHVTGVYDFAGRQLRIYVDGQLAGSRDNVALWRATGKIAIGRDRTNGASSGYFAGALDEVRVGEGVVTDRLISDRGGWGAPKAGQAGRFVNAAGDRYTGRTDDVREGYHFDALFGMFAAAGPNTRPLSACRTGTDSFTSADPACEGQTKIGELGLVYTVQPLNLPTTPLYRCHTATDRFDAANCDGATSDGLLGYTLAYGDFTRYSLDGYDHVSTTGAAPPSFRTESSHGFLALAPVAGTQQLFSCRNGYDHFVSADAACEGKTVLAAIGAIRTTPSGTSTRAVYRCAVTGGDSMISTDPGCEGQPVDRLLGYALTSVPADTAVFEPMGDK
ncbi:LamG domain-containing protein [Lentzea sp. NPDC006480]|uniref:LamG domain-containing protein n=1 Tax=Lentzea sp. NPDC006480 TaxID=3157176 RepID=UPI0033B0A846